MKTRHYQRSEIYSFYDLTSQEQSKVLNTYFDDLTQAENDSYIRCEKEILPLSMFLRCEGSIWSGSYCTSYFSGYYIKVNKFGDEVTIADRYW